jgi:D-galactarolactone cycloisomerase
MRVVHAEVFHLRAPMGVTAGPAGAYNSHRETLLLRLTASDGSVGWGETYALPGSRAQLEALAAGLVDADLAAAWPRPVGLDEAVASSAMGAIDIAWHDLRGRALGVPVHTLLGGAVRKRIPAYASGFLYQPGRHPADQWPAEVESVLNRGFRVMKIRIGLYPPAEELGLLAALVESSPDGASVVVDAWGSYPPSVALRVGLRLGDLGIGWFEEPTHHGVADLAAKLVVPVAGGEMGRTRGDFLRWVTDRTYDILQPDVAICGGLGVAGFVAQLTALHGIGCVPHSWNGPVMAAATLHLIATMPWLARAGDGALPAAGPLLEYDTSPNPLMEDVVVEPLAVCDGFVTVPDSPGLGIEVDEQAIARYRLP